MATSRQRVYASLLVLGAGVLAYRTVAMLSAGALTYLVPWVSGLLVAEGLIDVATIVASMRWWRTRAPQHASVALWAGATATIVHAFRVLIFVVGRTGPWVDFDVRPEHRAVHPERWSWGWVYFAAALSALGVVGVIVIWSIRRRARLTQRGERLATEPRRSRGRLRQSG